MTGDTMDAAIENGIVEDETMPAGNRGEDEFTRLGHKIDSTEKRVEAVQKVQGEQSQKIEAFHYRLLKIEQNQEALTELIRGPNGSQPLIVRIALLEDAQRRTEHTEAHARRSRENVRLMVVSALITAILGMVGTVLLSYWHFSNDTRIDRLERIEKMAPK
jgi:hypothetical protein